MGEFISTPSDITYDRLGVIFLPKTDDLMGGVEVHE
jgi:hypothetical protein